MFEEDEQNEASKIQNEQVDNSTGRIEEPLVQLCSKKMNKMKLRQVKMNKVILRMVESKNHLCRRKEDPQEQELNSTRLNGYGRFRDQEIDVDGD